MRLVIPVVVLLAFVATVAPLLARRQISDSASQVLASTSPSASAAPSATEAAAQRRTYSHPTQGWSAEIPRAWNVVEGSAQTTFRSYDPARVPHERDVRNQRPFLPPSEIRLDVQRISNFPQAGAKELASEVLAAPDPSKNEFELVERRDDLVIAGQPATLLIIETTTHPQPVQRVRQYFVLSQSKQWVLMVRAWPDLTSRSAELDRFLATLVIQ